MATYTVQVEAGNRQRTVWQALAPAETVEFDGSALDLAEAAAQNQDLAGPDAYWQVCVWAGARSDGPADATHVNDPALQRNRGGRPEIGPAVKVRCSQEMLDTVDELATEAGKTRAAMLRDLLAAGLAAVQPSVLCDYGAMRPVRQATRAAIERIARATGLHAEIGRIGRTGTADDVADYVEANLPGLWDEVPWGEQQSTVWEHLMTLVEAGTPIEQAGPAQDVRERFWARAIAP